MYYYNSEGNPLETAYRPTPQTTPTRYRERAQYDRDAVHRHQFQHLRLIHILNNFSEAELQIEIRIGRRIQHAPEFAPRRRHVHLRRPE